MKIHSARIPHRRGFTLVELLVVIVIIVSLAFLVSIGTRKAMAGAHQSRNVNQMRDIGAAVALWASEHNNNEPMYFANGTGDYGEEGAMSGKNPLLSPGNPAKLLYKKGDPSASYVQDHSVFFSSLGTYEIPEIGNYDPQLTSSNKPWGSFAWLYPSTTRPTPRQLSAMGGFSNTKIGREAYENVIMANDYRGVIKPRYKPYYHALFRDGSVRYIGDSASKWTAWLRGDND